MDKTRKELLFRWQAQKQCNYTLKLVLVRSFTWKRFVGMFYGKIPDGQMIGKICGEYTGPFLDLNGEIIF